MSEFTPTSPVHVSCLNDRSLLFFLGSYTSNTLCFTGMNRSTSEFDTASH
jgi:hypothetical protein